MRSTNLTTRLSLPVVAFLALSTAGEAVEAPAPAHLEFVTLAAWRGLAPELAQAEVCNLTHVAHGLWEAGALRLPDPSLRGDANADGTEDRAIRLRVGDDAHPCQYVLIVTPGSEAWQLVHLQRIQADDRSTGDLVWTADQAIGIDSGQTERFTRAAAMWSNGTDGGSAPGYVIDVQLIFHVIRWNPTLRQFEYARLETPLMAAEPDELQLLRDDGQL